jgi:lysophospholipase
MKKNSVVVFFCLIVFLSCSDSDQAPHFESRIDGEIQSCTEDVQIAYQVWRYNGLPEATLVFLNGRTEYTDKYHHLIELIDQPWDVIMFDHYGQGRSGGPRSHADNFDDQHVCDMKLIIDELADNTIPVAVIAHSMGGYVATRFAQLYPETASVFALSSPMYGIPLPGGMDEEAAKALSLNFIESGLGEQPTGEASPRPDCDENIVTHDCELYNQFKDDPYTLIGEPTWGWAYAALTGFESLFEDAENITKPVLIMQAGDELVVLPEKQQEFCELLGSQLCTLSIYENDYHELFNETDRENVMEESISFIQNVLEE